MSFWEVLSLAVGLAMDAFSVALCVGAAWRPLDRRGAWRLAWHFGFFQFLMPVLGWAAGLYIEQLIKNFDHWVAFALLGFVGLRMLRAGLSKDQECYCRDPTRGAMLLMLSVATSIDALAVGLSLALLKVQILYPSLVIGAVTLGFSLAATKMGNLCGLKFGKRMEIAGGLILIAIGVRIVALHLAA